jgi:hypothetical protein
MLGKDIAEMTAYNQNAAGDYDELEDEMQSFVGAISSLKSLKAKIGKAIVEFDARINNQPEARVSILGKGQDTKTQFAPTVAFRNALLAVQTAIADAETAVGVVDFPTA